MVLTPLEATSGHELPTSGFGVHMPFIAGPEEHDTGATRVRLGEGWGLGSALGSTHQHAAVLVADLLVQRGPAVARHREEVLHGLPPVARQRLSKVKG